MDNSKFIQKPWQWPEPLQTRISTKYIVIHHTAGPENQDVGAIWQEHVNIGDDGIAYTLVDKTDGTLVQGRPDWAICAAAHGVNQVSINIVLEGNFQGIDTPTPTQIESLKYALRYYLWKYPGAVIIGHRDVPRISGDPGDATACPGDTLYAMLPAIIKEVAAA